MEFVERFIGYVDVLGFESLVEAAEVGTGLSLNELISLLKDLGTSDERLRFERNGPIVCPQSSYSTRNLDFRITQVSDCVVVSAEVSPAGVINLVNHCWGAAMMLLHKGIMCRGFITRGKIYHTAEHLVGSGYQRAYHNERNVSAFKQEANERGTPFVEVDGIVSQYVDKSSDNCVKMMFSRFVKRDGDLTALFPFQALSHSFMVSGARPFNAEAELRANENLRRRIRTLKEFVLKHVDLTNTRAVQLSEHYIRALDDQLNVCDETEDFITALDAPILGRSIWEEFGS
jgi:hypothetical protein